MGTVTAASFPCVL